MKQEGLGIDAIAMLLALVSAGLLLSGHRPAGAALGAAALTVLAVGSWARTRRTQTRVAELEHENDALRQRLDHLEPLASTGLASAGLAHELKNALMVTHGFAQLARQSATEPKVLAHLETVEGQTQRLVEQLRSFVRLAAPEPETMRRPLGEVLDELARLLAPLARHRELAFTYDFPEVESLTREVTDPDLRAALLDLLLNALDHATSTVRFVVEPGDATRIIVQDDGPGVAPGMKGTLFRPFATGRLGGLGLGLHRAKAAAEREGAALGYEDVVEGGARFVMTLPRIPEETKVSDRA